MSLVRSCGVLTPLFSLRSQKSVGVGEFPDLNLLVDWCGKTGFGILQLLPMNDVGFNFRPYDSESSFALEPMHVCLEKIAHDDAGTLRNEIEDLRKKFPLRGDFYDTGIKKAKLELLRKIFKKRPKSGEAEFRRYCEDQKAWLDAYAEYKVLKDRFQLAGWMSWPEEFRRRKPEISAALEKDEAENLAFHRWTQWQLFLQFRAVKEYAAKKNVGIMGDIPFLVARDSADVWAHPEYFKLEFSAGAPPDLYFADGQEWGMPPYRWSEIEAHGYDYVAQKLRYAENFYDYFRIDHFVGVFRVWTFPREAPSGEKRKGAFDPPDESIWDEHGRKIVEAMRGSTRMHPCAEDLGCVPDCSEQVLEDYGIPGIDVQRWMRHWETTKEFKKAEEYRPNAIAVISTHDTTPLLLWWKTDAGSADDRQKFWQAVGLQGPHEAEPSMRIVEACFEAVSATRCVFSIQLFQDWLAYAGAMTDTRPEYRINVPGVVHDTNWRWVSPVSLEELQSLPGNSKILKLNRKNGRAG